MSSTPTSINLIKPIAMAGCVIVADKFILGEYDMTKSVYFGAATGAVGTYFADMLAPMVSLEQYLPDGTYTDSKTLEIRLLEISVGAGVGYAVNKYVLKNDYMMNVQMNKLAVLAGSSFLAEYIDDYVAGRSLAYFTK